MTTGHIQLSYTTFFLLPPIGKAVSSFIDHIVKISQA